MEKETVSRKQDNVIVDIKTILDILVYLLCKIM